MTCSCVALKNGPPNGIREPQTGVVDTSLLYNMLEAALLATTRVNAAHEPVPAKPTRFWVPAPSSGAPMDQDTWQPELPWPDEGTK